MKKQLFVLTVLFNFTIGWAQPSFVHIDSLTYQQFILPNRIVVGELHQVPGTYKTYAKIIRSFNPEKHYKLVIERSISFSYLINAFLSGSDTSLLDRIPFHSDEEKIFYASMYTLNKTLEPAQKLLTIGIDIEYQLNYAHTLFALRYYLPKISAPPSYQKIQEILADSNQLHSTKVKHLLALIDTTLLSNNTYDRIIKSIYRNAQNTLAISDASGLTWGRKREQFLLENFQNRVSGTTHFMLIIGVAHLPDNTLYPSFTKKLATDTATLNYYYPIYFNHTTTKYLKAGYYCEHRKNPLKSNQELFTYFDSHPAAWILKKDGVNYLMISN